MKIRPVDRLVSTVSTAFMPVASHTALALVELDFAVGVDSRQRLNPTPVYQFSQPGKRFESGRAPNTTSRNVSTCLQLVT